MARGKPITVSGFFIKKNGETVPMETLTREEMIEINKEWIKRWEAVLSDYYSHRPEEFKKLPEATAEGKERYYSMFPEKNCSVRIQGKA